MSGIKAFVGHSFTENDTEIVRYFLDLFDRISALGIGFSWEHAEGAEPKVLTEKVLELIEGKNLFIGICTAKETVVTNTRKSRINKNDLVVEKKACFVKTSDWIIQEIGLAIGKNMKVMLLLEEGIRPPGGLQGNLEYIEFKKDSPEKAFLKILEMIKAINPKSANAIQVIQLEDQSEMEDQSDINEN